LLCFPRFGKAYNASGENGNNEYEMAEVVVSATRLEVLKSETSANITVVLTKDIENLTVSNAAEVL
jgi:outer membrane cobalamin receptor